MGLKAFSRLAERWSLSDADAAALLNISTEVWDRVRADNDESGLGDDQMTGISVLVGIFERLHRLFADEMADRWPSRPNKGAPFTGRSPVASMIEDGVPQMLEVRAHVDRLLGLVGVPLGAGTQRRITSA